MINFQIKFIMTQYNMINNINLEGLLGNDLIFYNRIMNDFYNRILQINTSTSVNCNINIDKMYLKNSNNCNIEIVNKCFSNIRNSLNILLKTLVDNKQYMSDDLRSRIEKGLQIDLDINIDKQPNLLKNCNLVASIENNIIIKELIIENCSSINNSKFLFYNTGDANTNCGMVEIINAISKKKDQKEQKEYEYYLNKFLFLNLFDILTLIIIMFITICIIILINIFVYRNKSLYYISKYFIKNEK